MYQLRHPLLRDVFSGYSYHNIFMKYMRYEVYVLGCDVVQSSGCLAFRRNRVPPYLGCKWGASSFEMTATSNKTTRGHKPDSYKLHLSFSGDQVKFCVNKLKRTFV
jgi:hypothetical protein